MFSDISTSTNSVDPVLDKVSVTMSTSAIPEPSTYSAIFGALALGAAAFRRRQARA